MITLIMQIEQAPGSNFVSVATVHDKRNATEKEEKIARFMAGGIEALLELMVLQLGNGDMISGENIMEMVEQRMASKGLSLKNSPIDKHLNEQE